MAVRRGASIGELELGVYSEDLLGFELEDIHAVLNRIGLKRPQEFETRLPDCPTLVDAIKEKQRQRETRIRPEQLSPEVRQALERTEELKRLESEGRVPASEPIGKLLDELGRRTSMALAIPMKRLGIAAPVQVVTECPHCQLAASLEGDPAALARIAKYYNDKALRALSKVAQESQQV